MDAETKTISTYCPYCDREVGGFTLRLDEDAAGQRIVNRAQIDRCGLS